jgi:plastocyanin
MSRRIVTTALLCVISGLAFAGCGTEATPVPPTQGAGNGSGQADVQEITITSKDSVFDPATYTAEAGKPIKLTVVNAGQNVHEVEVKDLMPETKLAPGQSKTVELPAQQAGTHRIYCEIHEDEKMEGEFIIK